MKASPSPEKGDGDTCAEAVCMLKTIEVLRHFLFEEPCCICGSYSRFSGPTCHWCWSKIIAHFRAGTPRQERDLRVLALLSWIPGYGADLAKVLYTLKRETRAVDWNWVAREWLKHVKLPDENHCLVKPESELLLVPIPSPTGRRHSYSFALALAELLGTRVLSALEFPPERAEEQKKQKRSVRERRHLVRREEITLSVLKAKTIVLIDDVVTTGSTARAARKALGLKKVEIWCLAERRQLAASP